MENNLNPNKIIKIPNTDLAIRENFEFIMFSGFFFCDSDKSTIFFSWQTPFLLATFEA
jgi:hypothetical protein